MTVRAPRRIVTPDAEILRVRGEYAVVMLAPATMSRGFGPRWRELSLFYGVNRALVDGKPAMLNSSTPLRPLAKGTPVLVISGDAWTDLLVPMYALETRTGVLFHIDLTRGEVTVESAARPSTRVPELTPDGRLFFR